MKRWLRSACRSATIFSTRRLHVVWHGALPFVVHWNGRDEDGWWSVEWGRRWFFGAPKTHTLRHPDPISPVPIFRWRVTCGPLELRRWNCEQERSPHYTEDFSQVTPGLRIKLG